MDISVVVPVYNNKDLLIPCVDSLLAQYGRTFEIILIDDGSTDGSSSICDKLEKDNKNIKVIHQHNKGVSVARNLGMHEAAGNFLTFVDADDTVDEGWFSNISEQDLLKEDLIAFQHTASLSELGSDDGLCKEIKPKKAFSDALHGNEIDGYLHGKLFRNTLIKDNDIHFLEGVSVWEDMDFIMQFICHSHKIRFYEKKVYYYRQNENSAVHNMNIDKKIAKLNALSHMKELSKKFNPDEVSFINQLLVSNAASALIPVNQLDKKEWEQVNSLLCHSKEGKFNISTKTKVKLFIIEAYSHFIR